MKAFWVILLLVIFARAAGSDSASEGCTVDSWLQEGTNSGEVACLETRLEALGYEVDGPDRAFGASTREQVVKYQQARGLIVDGRVGPQTGGSLGIWKTTPTAATTETSDESNSTQNTTRVQATILDSTITTTAIQTDATISPTTVPATVVLTGVTLAPIGG